MLRKHSDIFVDPKDPFGQDCLERKISAENLTLLLESTSQPFVISVEAPWGWGKTTFIRMWKALLESRDHLCLYFNAWNNDYVDDPLIAFISEIGTLVNEQISKGNSKSKIQKHWDKVQTIGGGVLRMALPLAVQIATQGFISSKNVQEVSKTISSSSREIGEFLSDLAKERIKQYEAEKLGIKQFKSNLEKLAKILVTSSDKKPPIIFFIDEMDRCRPDFAIALLERVKHLFSVEGVIFVIAIDRGQIIHSIRSIYGLGMKAEGYLRRFIDLGYRLPQPSSDIFCRFLFNRFKLNEVYGARKGPLQSDPDYLINTFAQLANIFNFSLRLQEQCFTEMNLVLRTTSSNGIIFPVLLPFLVALKAYNQTIYNKLHADSVNIQEILSCLETTDAGISFLNAWEGTLIEAYFIVGYLSEDEIESKIKELESVAKNDEHPEKDRVLKILKRLGDITSNYWNEKIIVKSLVSHLDMVSDFVTKIK
ncbi:MAG: P-loop NTPase fold protein [Candidatus Tritonobacter lacicola]|nr:P-loop NTPase fold protein [Candidatus Tritonobacter lacicola]